MTGKNRGKRKADASSSQDSELEVWEETYELPPAFFFSLFFKFIKYISETHGDYVVLCCVPFNS